LPRGRFVLPALLLLSSSFVRTAAADSFLGDGIVVTDVGDVQDHLHAIAVAGDALYLAGMDSVPHVGRWRVEKRRLSDGALVPEFGDAGVLAIDPTADWDRITAIAVDGRHLFLVGEAAATLRIEKRVAYDGRLRTTFGSGGVLAMPNETVAWQSANTALVVEDHLYVATGTGRVLKLRTRDGGAVARFKPADTPPAASTRVTALAASNRALYIGAATDQGFRFEKRGLQAGRLFWTVDESFSRVGCGIEAPQALVVANGTLVAGGMHGGRWHLERRRERDGALLWTVDLPGTGDCDVVNDVVVVGDELFAVGSRGSRRRIEKRRLADGALVSGFGVGGALVAGRRLFEASSAAITCGDLIVGGTSYGEGDRLTKESWVTARVAARDGLPVVASVPPCGGTAR